MDIASRIAQFENMCQADPDNDMAHFSLGGAYAQDGRHEDAGGHETGVSQIEILPGIKQ